MPAIVRQHPRVLLSRWLFEGPASRARRRHRVTEIHGSYFSSTVRGPATNRSFARSRRSFPFPFAVNRSSMNRALRARGNSCGIRRKSDLAAGSMRGGHRSDCSADSRCAIRQDWRRYVRNLARCCSEGNKDEFNWRQSRRATDLLYYFNGSGRLGGELVHCEHPS